MSAVTCVVNLGEDGGMYDLGTELTTSYRSGSVITSRFVEVFPIHYSTGTEYEYCPVDENGGKLYNYPTPVYELPIDAIVAIYANTPAIATNSVYVRSALEQAGVGAPRWQGMFERNST